MVTDVLNTPRKVWTENERGEGPRAPVYTTAGPPLCSNILTHTREREMEV